MMKIFIFGLVLVIFITTRVLGVLCIWDVVLYEKKAGPSEDSLSDMRIILREGHGHYSLRRGVHMVMSWENKSDQIYRCKKVQEQPFKMILCKSNSRHFSHSI